MKGQSNLVGRKTSRDNSTASEPRSLKVAKDVKAVESFVFDVANDKIKCSFCERSIVRSIKILCAECKDLIFCLDCLVLNSQKEELSHDHHSFHVLDNLNFHVFTSNWTAKEELLMLIGIQKYGLDNWEDIQEFIGSKAKLQCEAHYYNFFYKHKNSYLPKESQTLFHSQNNRSQNDDEDKRRIEKIKENPGEIPDISNKDNKNNRARSVVKNRHRKDQNTISSASEILGYWPKREEFDVEYLNDAELEIAELEFNDDDSEEDRKLKFNVLKAYNCQLDEREKRKRFVIDNNLLDIKRTMNFERKLAKDDREIYNCLKPLQRFVEPGKFQELFDGIVLEKNIRQRINQLKNFK